MNTRVLNALCKIASGAKEQRRALKEARKAAKKTAKQVKKDFKRGVPIEQIGRNIENRMTPVGDRVSAAFGIPSISAEMEARQREIEAASKQFEQQQATKPRSIWSRLFGN